MQQGTPEWLQARCGKVTASRVHDVCARTKSGYGASRANYMAELIAERLTGKPAEQYVNAAMTWGIENECFAKRVYEERFGVVIEDVGFSAHPFIEMSGASPDGLIGDAGLIEAKCPNTSTHLDTLISKTIPGKYVTQMQWQMACTNRLWCDFVSYDPRLPEKYYLFVKRVERDDKLVLELEAEVNKFLAELDAKLAQLEAA